MNGELILRDPDETITLGSGAGYQRQSGPDGTVYRVWHRKYDPVTGNTGEETLVIPLRRLVSLRLGGR